MPWLNEICVCMSGFLGSMLCAFIARSPKAFDSWNEMSIMT